MRSRPAFEARDGGAGCLFPPPPPPPPGPGRCRNTIRGNFIRSSGAGFNSNCAREAGGLTAIETSAAAASACSATVTMTLARALFERSGRRGAGNTICSELPLMLHEKATRLPRRNYSGVGNISGEAYLTNVVAKATNVSTSARLDASPSEMRTAPVLLPSIQRRKSSIVRWVSCSG
jgi:hypothetical protein